jgi:hypothetical protein
MSFTAIQEYNQYNYLINMSFNNLLNKLYNDIYSNNDISWLYNQFLSTKLYYKLINSLDYNAMKKFNILNNNLVLPTKSKLKYNEIENILNDFYINEEYEVNDYNENLNDYDNNYDDDIYYIYKKSEKD